MILISKSSPTENVKKFHIKHCIISQSLHELLTCIDTILLVKWIHIIQFMILEKKYFFLKLNVELTFSLTSNPQKLSNSRNTLLTVHLLLMNSIWTVKHKLMVYLLLSSHIITIFTSNKIKIYLKKKCLIQLLILMTNNNQWIKHDHVFLQANNPFSKA